MEYEAAVSSSSPTSVIEDDPSCIKKLVTSISEVKVEPPDVESMFDQDSFESCCGLSSYSVQQVDGNSSLLSETAEGTSEETPANSNTPSSSPNSIQKNSPPESSNLVLLKRGPSNSSFSSTKAPSKKSKDSLLLNTHTKIKKEEKETDSKDAAKHSSAILEELLHPFEQYVMEHETARARMHRKPRKVECDVDSNFISIRDLPLVAKPWKPVHSNIRTFKPKSLLPSKDDENDRLLLRIVVSAAQDPRNVYITLIDEEWTSYEEMVEEMQDDLVSGVQARPDTWKGHACAVKIRDQWYRALVEELEEGDQVAILLVDNGNRQTVSMSSCYRLPDKYLEMPAQALRCVLDGLQPVLDPGECSKDCSDTWDWEALSYLRQLRGEKGLAHIERVSLGQVGKVLNRKEYAAHCILHVDSADVSVNRWLCDRAYAVTDRNMDVPNRKKIMAKFDADELSQASFSDQEDDKTSRSSVTSKISTEAASPVNEAEDRTPLWYDNIGAQAYEGFSFGSLHGTISSADKASEFCAFFPVGMEKPDGNNKKVCRRKNPLTLESHVRSKKPIEEMSLGPLLFCWCESPNAIYVQTREMRDKLSKLIEEMNQHYQDTEPTGSAYIEIGYKCAVFCDGCWWRAVLTNNDSFPLYRVHLLDRGNQRTVHASDLRPLEDGFQGTEKLVYRLCLKGIYPKTGNFWGDDVNFFITERLLGGEDINFRYSKHDQLTEQFFYGTLFYTYDLEEGPLQIGGLTKINMSDQLVSLDLASLRSYPAKQVFVLKTRTWRPATYPYIGDRFWAKVTWVNMQGEIFLHDVKAEVKLEEVSRILSERYEKTLPTKADMNPKPGDICVAKYTDGKWYRCVVEEVHQNEGTATLLYEDYGTKDATSLRDIRLDVILEDIPIQSWRCKIHNVKPIYESWDWDTLTSIHSLIVEHEFACEVAAKEPDFTVILRRKSGVLLSTQLVRKSLVSYENTSVEKSTKVEEVIVLSDSDDSNC